MTFGWQRVLLGALTLALFAFTTWIVLQPARDGYSGAHVGPGLDSTATPWTVAHVALGSPADKAGLRAGDVIVRVGLPPAVALSQYYARVGSVQTYTVRRGESVFNATVPFTTVALALPPASTATIIAVNALYAFLVLMLIARAWGRPEGRILVAFLLLLIATNPPYELYASTPLLAFSGDFVSGYTWAAALYVMLLLVTTVPPPNSLIRRKLNAYAFPIFVAAVVLLVPYYLAMFYPALDLQVQGRSVFSIVARLAELAMLLAVAAALIDGVMHVDITRRAQMKWLASTLLFMTAIEAVRATCFLFLPGGSPRWLESNAFAIESVAGVGATYAILRHKLVDLEFIVSRAAIFAVVSAVLVALFISLEWIAGKVADAAFGAGRAHGTLDNVVGFLFALAIGMSGRSIHRLVEESLNRTFFRKRYGDEQELRRFAQLADVATDAGELLDAAFATLRKHVEAAYIAIFVRMADGYRCVHATESFTATALGENDELVLRLRRFSEFFEVEDAETPFQHAVLFPMTMLRTLVGFVACGPKLDRTHYTSDEIEALTGFSQRVGTAYAWLRQSAYDAVAAAGSGAGAPR